MKLLKTMKRKLKDEAGQALPMALIMLVLGGLLVVPTLSFMTTNLNANRTVNTKTSAIYAADAGIADALWKLGNGVEPFPSGISSYDLAETLNGMTVTVDKMALEGDLYTLRSTARLDDQVKAVIIAQAVSGSDFSYLLHNAITSSADLNIQGTTTVIYGPVTCGGQVTGDREAIEGTITEGADVKLPTEAQLTALYLPQVDSVDETPYYYPDHGYSSLTYNVSGGTLDNPVIIPAMYRKGNLEITGSGYAQLAGTIFLARNDDGSGGNFRFEDTDVTLALNGQTIYATGNSGCPGCDCTPTCPGVDAVYFKSGCTLQGPGCIIALGNINFQPNQGVGIPLLGADADTGTTTEVQDRFVLSKFQAGSKTYDLGSIQVKCYFADPPDPEAPAHVKVAIYDATGSGDGPGACLWQSVADNVTVSSWHPVNLENVSPPIQITKKVNYWLEAIADADIISRKTATSSDSKYKYADFDTLTFVNNPSGLTDAPEYQIRGFSNGQEFIFLMSVCCATNVQPGADFYGSVAGNTSVNLQPGCFLNLVGVPEEGLDFPSMEAGPAGPGPKGNSPPILNYNIQ